MLFVCAKAMRGPRLGNAGSNSIDTRTNESLGEQVTDNAAVLNWDHLRKFTLGNHGLEVEILGLFVMEMQKLLGNLEAADTQRDWNVACHTIKGSARGVGADELGDLAAHAEGLSWPIAMPEREHQLSGLSAAFERVKVAIQSA